MADPKKEEFAGTLKALLWNVRVWEDVRSCAADGCYAPHHHSWTQIHELESTICDYDGNQDVLHDRVYVHNLSRNQNHCHPPLIFSLSRSQLAANLRTLASQRDAVDLYIPMELLRYLDDGGNPDSFTTEAFERAQEDNQLAKGRIDALQYVCDEDECIVVVQHLICCWCLCRFVCVGG